MKRNLIVFGLMILVLSGCKNDKKDAAKKEKEKVESTQQKSNLPKKDKNGESVVTGDFIYTPDAAVISGNNFIYGIVLDSMAKKLAQKVKPLKRNKYDMVPVTIKGKIKPNPMKGGWEHVIAIKKVLMISKPKGKPAIQIDSKKKVKKDSTTKIKIN